MIRKAWIKRFQSHEESELSFVNGINGIVGSSDSGKSAIIRALRWLFEYKPVGFSFHSTFAGQSDPTEVGVLIEGGTSISLSKSSSKTKYSLDSEILEALRAGVPDEVKSVLDIAPYNVQGQHDSYFLLQNTPGEVAREINDIIGLDAIDSVLQKVNSLSTATKQLLTMNESRLEEADKKLGEMDFLDDLLAAVERLETLLVERDDRRRQIKALAMDVRELNRMSREIRRLESWLSIEEQVQVLFKLARETENDDISLGRLRQFVKEVGGIDEEIAAFDVDISYEVLVLELKGMAKEQVQRSREIAGLGEFVESMNKMDVDIEEIEGKEKILVLKENELLTKVTICPVCRSPVDEDERELILNFFQERSEE